MGVKGEDRKVLNVPVLEKTVFSCNKFLLETNEEIQVINSEIRKLKDNGLDKLSGGQGDFIVENIKQTEKAVAVLKDNLAKISQSLNEKLGKVLDAYKDKNGLQDSAEKARVAAQNSGLKRG